MVEQNITAADPGTASVGTIQAGPYAGPLTWDETGDTFYHFDEDVYLNDLICALAAGGAPAQQHALLGSLGGLKEIPLQVRSTQVPPNSNLRNVPRIMFLKGDVLRVRSVQFSGAQEAVKWTLFFSKEKPPLR